MKQKNQSPLNPGNSFKNEFTVSNIIKVQPYSRKELCNIYNINRRQLAKWLEPFKEEVGELKGRLYTTKQVEIIFEKIGLPYCLNEA